VAFLATLADSWRRDRAIPRLRAAKPRNVKDYSDGARKPELRRTAWWGFFSGSSQRCFQCNPSADADCRLAIQPEF
jgi:hypothetical protein